MQLDEGRRIAGIKEATALVCNHLISMYDFPKKIEEINLGRYKIVTYEDIKIMVVYKRKHFLKFNEHAQGESINKDELELALSKGVKTIYVVYGDTGHIYYIPAKLVKEQSIIRSNEADDGKETYSFDIKLLTNAERIK